MVDNRRNSSKLNKKQAKLDQLIDALGKDLGKDEQEYISKLESYMSKRAPLGDDPALREAELKQREQERERIRNYKPTSPLYDSRQRGQQQPVKKPTVVQSTPPKKRSYQDDPRYKEFYDRLRKTTRTQTNYDEEIVPTSLEELEEQGWDGTLKAPAPAPEPSTQERIKQIQIVRPDEGSSGPDDLSPGSIILLDDGSIAVYKDSVSGKDYALFYFLEPDGRFTPRGIFLEQYETQRLGQLAPAVFESMRKAGRWERDAVLFHLDKYEYASHLRRLMARTPVPHEYDHEHAPAVVDRRNGRSLETEGKTPELEAEPREAPAQEPEPVRPRPKRDLLERGRVLRINVGGRVWESVCWTQDEISPIVAHNTNKEWALMHLDLARFRNSIEYGELLSERRIAEIERSLAQKTKE